MKTSVALPPTAARALGFLKRAENDLEIFVEDTASPNMWVKLLKLYLPAEVRLNSVSVLGPRDKVISACRADQAVDGRRKIYIVDGDLDLLRGVPKPRLRHLYRLRGYCVENYLLEEAAFVAAATTFDLKIERAAAARMIDLDGWLRRNEAALVALFVCYAVSHELVPKHETVRFRVHRLFRPEDPNYDLCETLVFRRTTSLYRLVRQECSRRADQSCVPKGSAECGTTRDRSCSVGEGLHYPLTLLDR